MNDITCQRPDCFANRNSGRCAILSDTKFPNRKGKFPGDKCPFHKTLKEANISFYGHWE